MEDWDPAPPTTAQRTVAGILLALIASTGANLYFEWRLFGDYDKQANVAALLVPDN